jgi:hypothetical protein
MVDLCRIKENIYQKPVGVVVGDFDGVREVAAIEVGSWVIALDGLFDDPLLLL